MIVTTSAAAMPICSTTSSVPDPLLGTTGSPYCRTAAAGVPAAR